MPNDNRLFPAGTGGNPVAPQLGTAANLTTTAQPPIRPPPDPFVLKSTEPFTDDDNVEGYVDGFGNRFWHVDTSASAKAVTFMAAADTVGLRYVVEWHVGANPLIIMETNGANVGGTTTFAAGTFGDSYMFQSDGTEYHLIAQSSESGYVSSNSFSAFKANATIGNLTVTGSATFSQTVAFLTSINVSGTASVNTLVVAGTASFSATVVFAGEVRALGTLSVSATASVGALTIAGAPLQTDWNKIGSAGLSNVLSAAISGSWTAYTSLRIEAFYLVSTTGVNPELRLSTDNGSTFFLAGAAVAQAGGLMDLGAPAPEEATLTISGVSVVACTMKAVGVNATFATKYIFGENLAHNGAYKASGSMNIAETVSGNISFRWTNSAVTATANSGQVNQISFSHRTNANTTVTMSSGYLYLYGLR